MLIRPDKTMRDLAQQLLTLEAAAATPSDTATSAMLRVVEKLRRPISMLAGTAGFRALLARAVNLAKVQSLGLGEVRVTPDGSLEGLNPPVNGEAEEAGTVLIAQLLALLSAFIGGPLTLRLLQDAWPHWPPSIESPGGNHHDPKR